MNVPQWALPDKSNPASILTPLQQGKQQDKDFEEKKKIEKKIKIIKRNLEAVRETQNTSVDNSIANAAVLHWKIMEEQIQTKINNILQRAESQIAEIKERAAKNSESHQTTLVSIKAKREAAEERLKMERKTEKHRRLEKELKEMVDEYNEKFKVPIENSIPGIYSTLNNTTSPPTANPIIVPQPVPQPVSQPVSQPVPQPVSQPVSQPVPKPVPQPQIEEEEEEEEEEDYDAFMKLTPWKKYLNANKGLSLYKSYHGAIEMGITPEIPEPPKPVSKLRVISKTSSTTISRDQLSKVLPNY